MDLTFILAVAPPLLIVAYIIKADRFPEPKGTCFLTFVAGTIIIIPAAILNDKLIPDASYAYLAGFTEETLKFLTIYFYVSRNTNFDEPMDAIVYGTLISLGFATFENLQYVYYSGGSPDLIAIIRAFTAIPLHACCGIIMGYYFGLYIFKDRDKINLLKSLFFAIGFHAAYNYFATRDILLMILILIILILFAKRLHKIFRKEQGYNSSFKDDNEKSEFLEIPAEQKERQLIFENLITIPGLTENKINCLLDQYSTKDLILNVSIEVLSSVPGISEDIATAIQARLRNI